MPFFSPRIGKYLGEKISFWHRFEIYAGHSLEEFSRIRSILDERKIKHAHRQIKGRQIMYYIYVHDRNEEAAKFLIRK